MKKHCSQERQHFKSMQDKFYFALVLHLCSHENALIFSQSEVLNFFYVYYYVKNIFILCLAMVQKTRMNSQAVTTNPGFYCWALEGVQITKLL